MKLSSMKTLFAIMVTLLLVAPSLTIAQTPGWQLYDNFQSGSIDTDKWIIDKSSALVSAKMYNKNGVAVFVHNTTKINDASWLQFKKWPEKIKAIRAKVKFANDRPGDVQARIGGWLGKNNAGDWVYLEAALRNDYDRVQAAASVLDPNSNPQFKWKYDLFYSHVTKPDGLVGNWYTLEIYFNRSNFLFKGNGVNEITHQLTENLYPPNDYFKGIGTRNGTAASGTCTVYFDDIWVLY